MDVVYALVRAVADRAETEPTALPPLYETIDPDALADFVESAGDETVSVRFTYCGYPVQVAGDGSVAVEPRNAQ